MRQSYVGVASVTTSLESDVLVSCTPLNAHRVVAIGVWVSSKTLDGIGTKYPNREVFPSNISSIFPEKGTLNLIHYNCDNFARMYNDLELILVYGGPKLGGIQINQNRGEASLDSIDILRRFSKKHVDRNLRIILQVRPNQFQTLEALKQWLRPYLPSITDVLLDVSLGLGKRLDVETVNSYLKILKLVRKHMPTLGLGVAGGLADDNLTILTPLFKKFPDLNIDAEGRLRDAEDKLDIEKAKRYLIKAFEMT